MFLLRGMSHILSHINSKLEDFFDDYSEPTCFIMTFVFLWVIDIPLAAWMNVRYGWYSPKAQQIMLFAAGIEFFICIVFSILTVIMGNVNYRMAYYTKAMAISFLLAALVLAGFAAAGFLVMLIS